MIKSAAASASGSLALGIGSQAAPADDAAVSTDFAALLDSTVATSQDDAIDPAALLEQAIGKQTRQANGNAAGKMLPHSLPDAAAALAHSLTLALSDAAKPAEGAVEDSAATAETTATPPAIATPIMLPGLFVPISAQLPQTPSPAVAPATNTSIVTGPTATERPGPTTGPIAIRQSTTESLAQAAAAQAIRSALPGTTEGRAAKAEKADAPAQPAKASGAQIAASLALPQTATAILPGAATRADQISVTIAPAEKAVGAQAPATPAAIPAAPAAMTAAVTIVPGPPSPADQIRVTVAPAEQPAPNATPTSAQLASVQAAGAALTQGTGRAATTAKTIPPKVQQPSAEPAMPAQPAEPAMPAQAAANAAQPNTPAMPHRNAASSTADVPTLLAKAAATAIEAPAAPAQAFAAMPAQPLFGLQDGQSISQTLAPVTAAPTTNGVGPTGHDFAALVDRLVEARDAASPASVNAAIKHSEFGQVSLRFDQDAGGLSVAMSSADPEFARAVQASSAQSQMSGDNGSDKNNGAHRHDTSSQQQTAGSSSGQSQSQAQTQSSASGRGDHNSQTPTVNRTGRTSGQPTRDADAASTRGGIYA